jgi:hypothetical protein
MDFFDAPTIAGLAVAILAAQAPDDGMDRILQDLEQLSDEEAARLLAEGQ